MRFDKSLELYERALKVTPEATQTISKGNWPIPLFLQYGWDSWVRDVDGNHFLDYSMSLGSVILGHGRIGTTGNTGLSAPTRLEVELAEKICEIYPGAEMVRFFKNGSDATEAAVRLARAYTGRREIIFNGYHGFHDWYIWNRYAEGVKEDEECLRDGNYPSYFTAAFIIDPTSPTILELEQNLSNCQANGALFIFDEVISGFRYSLGGAAQHYGITPDLVCLGKAMGNGYPISAVAGRRDIMMLAKDCFLSSTFGGDTIGLSAALSTIKELEKKDYNQLWDYGAELVSKINWISWTGSECRPVFEPPKGFVLECMKRSILAPGFHNISFAHTKEDLTKTIEVYKEAWDACKDHS